MNGYQADPAEMAAAADQLAASAEQVHAAATALGEGAGGDLGPAGITEAVERLTRESAARMTAVHASLLASEQGVRAVRDAYVETEHDLATRLRNPERRIDD
ncbi:MAG: hypothetical protein ABW224_12555 [Kibdelosporangium sp.]